MKLKDIPAFPPHVDDAALAFGETKYLPNYSDLPDEYVTMQAPACKLASVIFYTGWGSDETRKLAAQVYGEKMGLAEPPEGHDYTGEETNISKRFVRAISAELKSWEPKHEHKIAGVGYLIDRWSRKYEGKMQ